MSEENKHDDAFSCEAIIVPKLFIAKISSLLDQTVLAVIFNETDKDGLLNNPKNIARTLDCSEITIRRSLFRLLHSKYIKLENKKIWVNFDAFTDWEQQELKRILRITKKERHA